MNESNRKASKGIISDIPEEDELEFTVTTLLKNKLNSNNTDDEHTDIDSKPSVSASSGTIDSNYVNQKIHQAISKTKKDISRKQLQNAKELELKVNKILQSLKFNNPKVQERITHIQALLHEHVKQSNFTKD